jgi:hypothetical protein
MIDEVNFMDCMTKVSPQWLAGFFDGEGCVHARVNAKGNTLVRISITQRNKFVLSLVCTKFLPTEFRNRISVLKNGTETTETWEAIWVGESAVDLLRYIAPYSVVKQKLISLAIEFYSLVGGVGSKISEVSKIKREELVSEIKRINDLNHTYEVVQ